MRHTKATPRKSLPCNNASYEIALVTHVDLGVIGYIGNEVKIQTIIQNICKCMCVGVGV